MALEFELAADILRTAISPTWEEIGQLAAIAAIRTALNYFLQLEIDRAAARARDRSNDLLASGEPSANGSIAAHAMDGKRVALFQTHEDEVAGGQHAGS